MSFMRVIPVDTSAQRWVLFSSPQTHDCVLLGVLDKIFGIYITRSEFLRYPTSVRVY